MFEILIYILKGIFQLLMWTWWVIVPVIGLLAFQNFRKSKWVGNLESVVLWVKIPKNSEKGPTSAEMMFASLHSILKPAAEIKKEGSIQEHISFEMVADSESIKFYVWTPKHLQNFVEGQIYAQYPTAEISKVEDYSRKLDIDHDGTDDCVAGCELKLVRPDYFPIKTFVSFEVDPLAGITGALSKIENKSEKMWIQILTRPVSDTWRNKGLAYAESLKNGGSPKVFSKDAILHHLLSLPATILNGVFSAIMPAEETKGGGSQKQISHNTETALACLEEKANKLGYQVKIRIMYLAKSREEARQHLRITAGAFKQFNTTLANGFRISKIKTGNEVLEEYRSRLFTDKGFILNIEEVASLYHLPHASVETPNIVWTSSKKGEPPANLPYKLDESSKDLTIFAETTFRGQPRTFGIKRDDRRRHMYIIGKSGVGKSKLLELLAISDIKNGEGVGIVDPHGETVQNVMKHIPAHRISDVIYFNPADKDFPIGFNPLETTPELREETASGFVSVFKRLFGYSWGPRLEYVMRYTILALSYSPEATMLDVVRMLTDKDYRKKIVTMVEDPVVKTFWLKEFSTYNDRFATEAVAPILNKVGQFTASPVIRNIVGQKKSTINLREAMDSQKILLVDLSTGKIGEDNSALLGSMIITKIQLAAMGRSKLSEEERNDFYLYVDEFQNFATESFATILSEARKYKLDLTVANQYIAQMEETVRDAVFGNVGTLISFRVGATDAGFLEKEFSPVFEKNDIINLDNRHLYISMLIDGVTSVPFSARTLDVPEVTEDSTQKIIEFSRERYGTKREVIEEKIMKWSNMENVDVEARIDKQKTSKFEMTNNQLEKGETPKKLDEKKKIESQRQTRYDSKKEETKKPVPIKQSVDPEELKRIIQKLTKPKEKPANPVLPTNLKVSESAKETPQPSPLAKKVEHKPEIKPSPAIHNTEQNRTVGIPKKEEITPGPETSAQDTANNSLNAGANIKAENLPNQTQGPILKKINPLNPLPQKPNIEENRGGTPKTIRPILKSPSIKRSEEKITANQRPQNQTNTSQNPRRNISPITPQFKPVIKPTVEIEEENVRKITKEEFLNLKEIQPNEKIVIVERGAEPALKQSVSINPDQKK